MFSEEILSGNFIFCAVKKTLTWSNAERLLLKLSKFFGLSYHKSFRAVLLFDPVHLISQQYIM